MVTPSWVEGLVSDALVRGRSLGEMLRGRG